MATRGLDEARGLEGMIPSRCHLGLDGVLRLLEVPVWRGSKVSNMDDPGRMGDGGLCCCGGTGAGAVAAAA